MFKKLFLLLMPALISGCAVTLTPEGSRVQLVYREEGNVEIHSSYEYKDLPAALKECKEVGETGERGFQGGEKYANTLKMYFENDLRNLAAEKGGNVVVPFMQKVKVNNFEDQNTKEKFTTYTGLYNGKVLQCPETKRYCRILDKGC